MMGDQKAYTAAVEKLTPKTDDGLNAKYAEYASI